MEKNKIVCIATKINGRQPKFSVTRKNKSGSFNRIRHYNFNSISYASKVRVETIVNDQAHNRVAIYHQGIWVFSHFNPGLK